MSKHLLLSLCLLGALLFSGAVFAYTTKELVEQCSPSVVQVSVYNDKDERLGVGSGFVVGPELVATCYHVVSRGVSAQVKTADKISYPVTGVVAVDKERDLAVLRVKRLDLAPLALGDAGAVKPGERVTVIGSALGLEGSVADGVVSQLRVFPPFGDVVQVSCPVSPGNSGGPLLNEEGQVIGVVSFSLVDGQNINFGISANTLKKLIDNASATEKTIAELNTSANRVPTRYGILEPRNATTEVTMPKSAPYAAAPFLRINYINGTLKVYKSSKDAKAGKAMRQVETENELTADTYIFTADRVLKVGKALAKKKLYLAFQFQPLRAAVLIPDNNAPRTNVPSVLKEKLESMGYEVMEGAEVQAVVASMSQDDPEASQKMAEKLNCAHFVVLRCDTGTADSGFVARSNTNSTGNIDMGGTYRERGTTTTNVYSTSTAYHTVIALAVYDLNADTMLVNRTSEGGGEVGNLVAIFGGLASANRKVVRKCLDNMLGTSWLRVVKEEEKK